MGEYVKLVSENRYLRSRGYSEVRNFGRKNVTPTPPATSATAYGKIFGQYFPAPQTKCGPYAYEHSWA